MAKVGKLQALSEDCCITALVPYRERQNTGSVAMVVPATEKSDNLVAAPNNKCSVSLFNPKKMKKIVYAVGLGLMGFMASCSKNEQSAAPAAMMAPSTHAASSSHFAKAIVISWPGGYAGPNNACPPPNGNCLNVIVTPGITTTLDGVKGDIISGNTKQLVADMTSDRDGLSEILGADNVEGVIAGTSTASFMSSDKADRDWYVFTDKSGQRKYVDVGQQ